MKVVSIYSDSSLIVETDSNERITYNEGDFIKLSTNDGFMVAGTVKEIFVDSVTVLQANGAVYEYSFNRISEIDR